jgi:hypothetical protein
MFFRNAQREASEWQMWQMWQIGEIEDRLRCLRSMTILFVRVF